MLSSHRRSENFDDRKVVWLEFIAASVIFSIVGLVIYMVFSYRP